jgi:hypothetical protein
VVSGERVRRFAAKREHGRIIFLDRYRFQRKNCRELLSFNEKDDE